MGKGKNQNQKNKRKQGDKQQAKAAREKVAPRDIARAEKRLAGALQMLDEARAELTKRETQLATLLRKHGRMPDESAQSLSFDNGASNAPIEAGTVSAEPVLSEAMGAEHEPQHTRSDAPDDRTAHATDEY